LGKLYHSTTLSRRGRRAQKVLEEELLGTPKIAINKDYTVVGRNKLRIAKKEEQHIACETVTTYTTADGLTFQYWARQRTLIPPWQLHWYQLRDMMRLKLANGLLEHLLKKLSSIAPGNTVWKKARWISKRLREIGIKWNFISIAERLQALEGRGKRERKLDTIEIRHLRGVLTLLKTPYHTLTGRIAEAGGVKNPKFPINLKNRWGARLLGAALGDGSLVRTKIGRQEYIHFKYSNKDPQLLEEFKKAIKKVFGDANISETIDPRSETHNLQVTSTLVGEALAAIGAPVGDKVKQNPPSPPILHLLTRKEKAELIAQLFSDDASPHPEKVRYSQSIDITDLLTQEEIKTIAQHVKPHKVRKEEKQHYRLPIGELEELARKGRIDKSVIYKIRSYRPRIMGTIREILDREFGVKCEYSPEVLVLSVDKSQVKASWRLRIYKESINDFKAKIGFISKLKERRMEE